jgi:hypothetical protein
MGLNRVNKIYKSTEWRPSFYVNVWKQSTKEEEATIQQNLNLGIPVFINAIHAGKFKNNSNLLPLNKEDLRKTEFSELTLHEINEMETDNLEKFWSYDPSNLVYVYHSMLVLIQLVVYMGFRDIILLGCDLGYQSQELKIFEAGLDLFKYADEDTLFGQTGSYLTDAWRQKVLLKSVANGIAHKILRGLPKHIQQGAINFTGVEDKNHFDSKYQLGLNDMTTTNQEIRKSHHLIYKIAEYNGINIYNGTVGGQLEVYPRVNIFDLVSR